jgi:HAD superfamily, subfamily IIIB (Acid phosphatase)
MIYIFDIDQTLADNSHRLHFIQGETKDWEGFHAAQGDDKPIWETITVARALKAAGQQIVYSTGRMESGYEATKTWLNKYRVPDAQGIYMRAVGDHREDFVVKSELLDMIFADYGAGLGGYGGVFEDRQQVVDMYRARGLRVFQVAKGDY